MLIPEFDVYLSYAPEDKDKVHNLVSALEESGLKVWWQHHHLKPKEAIALLQRQLNDKRVQMVVWSKNSAGSGRVQAEARIGSNRGRLIATRIEEVLPPRDTAAILYADLSDWFGGNEHGGMRKMFGMIWKLIGKGINTTPPPPPLPAVSAATTGVAPEGTNTEIDAGEEDNRTKSNSSGSDPVSRGIESIERETQESEGDAELAASDASTTDHANAGMPQEAGSSLAENDVVGDGNAHEPTAEELEEEAWQGAYNRNSRSGYSFYLKKYPEGIYAEEARAKLAQKKRSTQLIVWALVGFVAIYVIAVLVMGILAAT